MFEGDEYIECYFIIPLLAFCFNLIYISYSIKYVICICDTNLNKLCVKFSDICLCVFCISVFMILYHLH